MRKRKFTDVQRYLADLILYQFLAENVIILIIGTLVFFEKRLRIPILAVLVFPNIIELFVLVKAFSLGR